MEIQGKLLIISTQYHEGVHYAELPSHFVPIITQLEELHERGYVHGDIRAYNMVLQYSPTSRNGAICTTTGSSTASDSCKGWLIDFDYGWKKGEVTYPKRYKDELHDGIRPGKEGGGNHDN